MSSPNYKYRLSELWRYKRGSGYPPSEVIQKLKSLNLFHNRGTRGGKVVIRSIQVQTTTRTRKIPVKEKEYKHFESLTAMFVRSSGSSKRGLDLGLGRGFTGSQAAKHLMGLATANFAGGPGRKRRSSPDEASNHPNEALTKFNEALTHPNEALTHPNEALTQKMA
ncbi:hypothetical protein Pcinc_011348 [Petrolisthes cinctipes]|uniref:Uncharacterized protein n=1 Tax=Petrolisthes cinctipes TaxID=88211 RepID=A0AAE1G306_PETCI|nr:hypothetical protein Pcinc_011348 [Petrolisthes cinctipes]